MSKSDLPSVSLLKTQWCIGNLKKKKNNNCCKEELILHIQAFNSCTLFAHLWVKMEKKEKRKVSCVFCIRLPVFPRWCRYCVDAGRKTQAALPMLFYWHIKPARKNGLANELYWIKSIWTWSVSLDCLDTIFTGEQSIKWQELTAGRIEGSHAE